MSTPADLENEFKARRRFLKRLGGAAVAGAGLTAVAGLRIAQLQVLDYRYYDTQARDNYLRAVPVAPVRGLIYDRNGVLLARNVPSFDLMIQRDQVGDLKATFAALGRLLPITADDIARFHEQSQGMPSYRPVPLLVRMDSREVSLFEVNRYRFPGVHLRADLMRDYPLGSALSHVIGYVGGITAEDLKHIDPNLYAGLDQIGRAGVERSFENELRGTPGTRTVEVDSLGRPLHTLGRQAGVDGKDLYLAVDSRLQQVAMQALGKYNGAVVAIDPRNGEVLALVSKPGYDPMPFVEGISQAAYQALLHDPAKPLYNRALEGLFSPGSTIKPFMAFAGLQAGTLTDRTKYFCPGYFTLPGTSHVFHCWKLTGHGQLNLQQAIEQSCDVFFYHVAWALGISRIDRWLPLFGFGERTGVELPGELAGLLPNPGWVHRHFGHAWYPGETLNTGIGQGIWRVTPMQLAMATVRMAGAGTGFKPHIVRGMKAGLGAAMVAGHPEPRPRIEEAHAGQWPEVIGGMEMAAQDPLGTAWTVGHDAPYPIAAKTGTAQVADERQTVKGTVQYHDNALFISFAPADDPRIVVAVVAERGAEGAFQAAPVARQVMDMHLLGHVTTPPAPTST